jgi:hypothetical protein
MATQQLQLAPDNSTYANYSAWASAIDAWFVNNGASNWIQTNDTGQVMWSGMSITAVSMSGSNMTCTYSSLTGLPLYVGRVLTVTGWTGGNTGNNGTFVITALGAGTWTAVNASGVNVASGGTGVVTQQASAPGSGAFFYSIWQPNDGMTNFYVKMEYGNLSGTNNACIRFTIGSGTNGSGTITGITDGPISTQVSNVTNTTTAYDCRFSAAAGRFTFMMWRNYTSACQFVSIERSLNSSGTYTGSYVTYIVGGYIANNSRTSAVQKSFVFGVGISVQSNQVNSGSGGVSCRIPQFQTANNILFNNTAPVDLIAPYIGYYDYPMTTMGGFPSGIVQDGGTFQTTVYGNTVTYLMMLNATTSQMFWAGNQNITALLMRYD